MGLTVLRRSFTLLPTGVPEAVSIDLASVATIVAAGLPVAIVFQLRTGVFAVAAGLIR